VALPGRRLTYDGDLTGRPVSRGLPARAGNSGTTYPNVTYGHLADEPRVGYQAALVRFHSPTYGRFWLSVATHPGDTVACTQAEAMILAAEAKTGLSPLRRTDLLRDCLRLLTVQCRDRDHQMLAAQQALVTARTRASETEPQIEAQCAVDAQSEAQYRQRQRPERPYSALAKARRTLSMLKRRQVRLEKKLPKLEKELALRQRQLAGRQALEHLLQRRLAQFEGDNRTKRCPIQATFRLDADFGTRDNVALLIEMGYEVYTNPYSDWLTPRLKRRAVGLRDWTRVGHNAERIVWKACCLPDFPYPLDLAMERFQTGDRQKQATLIHFRGDLVTTDLPEWFHCYDAWQTIETGIEEVKCVFEMRYLKVRSQPGLCLQEQFPVFAANVVRWAGPHEARADL